MKSTHFYIHTTAKTKCKPDCEIQINVAIENTQNSSMRKVYKLLLQTNWHQSRIREFWLFTFCAPDLFTCTLANQQYKR